VSPVLATVTVVLAQIGDSSSQWGYVAAGYALVLGGIVLYAILTLRKGRQLARQLDPEDRRWMS
jgi:hypothetical protein